MLKILSSAALTATLATALAMPAAAVARDGAVASATSPDTTAQAQASAPTVKKRVRKVQPRQLVEVAPPAMQCFLFWCSYNGRSFSVLMLGVGY